MTTNHPSGFSFDTYPGLDRDLAEIYQRNVGSGETTDGDLAAAGLATAVNTALGSNPNVQSPTTGLSPEARIWMFDTLNSPEGALASWSRYVDSLQTPIPDDVEKLFDIQPNIVSKVESLYRAKQSIISSQEVNPEGLEIGESMKPILVPWRAIKNNLDRLPDW